MASIGVAMQNDLKSYVPTSRKVNNKALTGDISLTAADVGARASSWVPTAADVKALPLTGGTLTGNIIFSGTPRSINYNNGGWNGAIMTLYSGDSTGAGLVIGAGGRTIIGGGEAAASLRTALGTAATNESAEQMHVAGDGTVQIHTNCQTIASRKTFTFGIDGILTSPGGFKGNVTGNAATATKAATLTTARTIAISGAVTGTATSFNGGANITIPTTALDVSKATAGTLAVARGGTGTTNLTTLKTNLGVPTISSGTGAYTAGTTALANGAIYLQYE